MTARDDDKRCAALAAAAEIQDGMLVGLGTGSTAAFVVAELGRRVAAGLRITAVATSLATERAARTAGVVVVPFDDLAEIDIAIDGVDEIDPQCRAIKGAGGAMLREKIVASAARRMIAIGDGSKSVEMLGAAAVPVEMLPMARAFVTARIESLGAHPRLRLAGGGPYRTDQGNAVLDCEFHIGVDPVRTAAQLSAIPGIIGHGLFLDEIDTVYIADNGLVSRRDRAS